ncbi:sulfatase-like hydrolase/transferase [Methylotenera versatilis]|uniref:sulfatase-like hydrolase/transferase n=1 Tax=Methylotenera versatilis TaxID=1055487 RepID=UPI00068FB9A5|nr:sulfatase-like hydrolase/transferase [Methylotenera versatilis]
MLYRLSQIKFIPIITKFVVYFLAFFIFCFVIWLRQEFGEVSIDQILYHLEFGSEGLLTADQSIIRTFYNKSLLLPLILTIIAMLFNADCFNTIKKLYTTIKVSLVQLLSQHKLSKKLIFLPKQYYLLTTAFVYALFHFSAFSYFVDSMSPNSLDFYAQYYKAPSQTKIIANKPKNLVLIYVESLESTYDNKKIFNEDLLKNISAHTLGGVSFLKQRQITGTSWTMAGIVSTQCGIPLRPVFGGGDRRKNSATELTSQFLPNIDCLGDILKKHDYTNVFIGGAALSFAGKGKFFSDHGYDEIWGRDELSKILDPKLPQNHWGVFDDDLLNYAKHKIDLLEQKGSLYNVTLLTLDTHMPDGSYSKTCTASGAIEFKDIVRCTSTLLADLVHYMDKKGYLENTTVVIMGDHLVMTNPVTKKLQKANERFVFNNYIIKNTKLIKNRDEITHVDHLPTILDSINLTVEGGKIGLGISGFSQLAIPDNKARFELLNKYATKSSAQYLEFWQPQVGK